MSAADIDRRAVRPSARECICGQYHSGSSKGYSSEWFKNWCGNQCCWSQETCRKCGRTYEAVSGRLVGGGRRG